MLPFENGIIGIALWVHYNFMENNLMKKMSILDYIAIILVIIGGLNWGLVGILNFDLVAAVLGHMSPLARVVYSLVGVSAVYVLLILANLGKKQTS